MRKLFIILIGVLAWSHVMAQNQGSKPNVVVIVADDFGWADTGFQGSEFYETPNLDKLADEGMVFTNGYAACGVCSPSRASLLTGRYTPRSGITDWIRGYQAEKSPQQLSEYRMVSPQNTYNLPLEETTIAEVLKQDGYKTCFVGKWHLGEEDRYYPHNQGFDKNVAGWKRGSPSGNRTDNQSYYTPYNNPYLSDGEKGEFLTDRLVDESIQWINDNQSDPFLLYLSFYVVHTPIHPKPEKIPYYTEKAQKLGLTTKPALTKDVEWINNSPNPKWHWEERILQSNAEYAALIESMDENIGRVLDQIKTAGLDENTIVVFTSDNGGLSTAESSPTCNAPLRGGKGWLYEGGIREPFIIKMPGAVSGEVCNQPVHGIDIYPTIIEACGIEVPNSNEIDGVSLLPILNGQELNRDKLFWHYPHYGGKGDAPAGAIRKGDYKLIEFFETGNVELYNLENDISESENLSAIEPDIKNELLHDLQQWRANVGAKMPVENPYYKYDNSPTANLNVNVNDRVSVNADIFGINNDWKFISNELFPAFAQTFSSQNYAVLRYPGGWESEWVNWSTNSAPDWSDGPDAPGASIATIKSNYSNFSVVLPTRSAMDKTVNSASWNNEVAVLKNRAVEAINKSDAETLKYVEIGNEWWLQWAGGVSRSSKLINYSKIANELAAYIVNEFPQRKFNILINGDFTKPEEFAMIKNNMNNAFDMIDGLALHTYAGYHPPSNKIGFHINTLVEKIEACATNFNSEKDLIIYCSEWMAARDYNEGRTYMEAANIIPDILHIYARSGVDAAAYWPPVNSTAPGVGLLSWNASTVFPCGQILADMAVSYKGEVLKTESDGMIGITGVMADTDTLVLYITGKDSPSTNVTVSLNSFAVDSVLSVHKFVPADYSQTNKAAPYKTESGDVAMQSSSSIRFKINDSGKYEIFKIKLKGKIREDVDNKLIDFETPVEVTPDFGASFDVVDNPSSQALNKTQNCGSIGRTSNFWYELVDLSCNFSIPPNESLYLHVLVNYTSQPDVVVRLNKDGNNGNIRALNKYENIGEWQDLVFECKGGDSGRDIFNIRYMGDCGFENMPSGFVLDNSSSFAYIDEIIVNYDPSPRTGPSEARKIIEQNDFWVYSNNQSIYLNTTEDRNVEVCIYNLSGHLIAKHFKTSYSFEVPKAGLYLVKVGAEVKKVIVK